MTTRVTEHLPEASPLHHLSLPPTNLPGIDVFVNVADGPNDFCETSVDGPISAALELGEYGVAVEHALDRSLLLHRWRRPVDIRGAADPVDVRHLEHIVAIT